MEENKNIWKNFDTEKISRKNINLHGWTECK